MSAWWLGRLCLEAGLPPGVLNVVQGLGPEAGMPLVEDSRVDLVSFTGSAATGPASIAEAAGRRLAKTVMELGGKNALVVCDDADLDRAVEWTLASAFSNAGQRCAAASRIVVFDAVYDDFRERLAARGADGGSTTDSGPVISEASHGADPRRGRGRARGRRDRALRRRSASATRGWHVAPTLVEGVAPDAPLSCEELFGPVAALYRVARLRRGGRARQRLRRTGSPRRSTRPASTAPCGSRSGSRPASSSSTPGRTAASRTWASAASSSPGTGWKEAGVEALDVYSETQYVNLVVDPALT